MRVVEKNLPMGGRVVRNILYTSDTTLVARSKEVLSGMTEHQGEASHVI